MRTHAGLVYAIIRKCGFEGDSADELFHEVWLAAWEQLSTVPNERGVAGWLATLAAREATRALGRRMYAGAGLTIGYPPSGNEESGARA